MTVVILLLIAFAASCVSGFASIRCAVLLGKLATIQQKRFAQENHERIFGRQR